MAAWIPQTFDEACKRAAGRRAYNKRRRVTRQRRITAILRLLDVQPLLTGRELAAILKVHEATISRDLKVVRRVKREYRRFNGVEMHAGAFRWLPEGFGYQTVFEIRHGVRVR